MRIKASLIVALATMVFVSSLSAGSAAGHSKIHKIAQKKHQARASLKKSSKPSKASMAKMMQQEPLRMRRTESVPGLASSGEPDQGPRALEREKYEDRAFPLPAIPMVLTDSAQKTFGKVDAETDAGKRGAKLNSKWVSIGPTVAEYPAILNRTGTPYVASGRISALAIDPNCGQLSCVLYVGAAGGGIWKTENALSTAPKWKFISKQFATNSIGTITIDRTDPTGQTLYVGTGEPNASGDSGAGQGIYKSIDGGDSWFLLPGSPAATSNRSISDIVIDPTSSNTIYVGTTRGVRGVSSVSGGATGNPPGGIGPAVGLYKSTDGGNTFVLLWNPLPITPGGFSEGVSAVALDPANPAVVYASAFGLGVFRSSPSEAGGAFQQVFKSIGLDPTFLDAFSRTQFALTTKNGHTRIYVGDGGGNGPDFGQAPAAVWRADNADVPAADLLASQTAPTPGGWKNLSNPTNGTPGYATSNYCTGQCWYDNGIYTPAGQPDTVFVIGSYLYPEAGLRSNARAVLRSTTAGEPDPTTGVTFTDLTRDASSSTTPNGIHPDQHALVFLPGNPDIWFEGSDGGLMRSSGAYADVSSQCDSRPLGALSMATCHRLLSAVPTLFTNLNTGLNTLQFQSLSINPSNPTGELLGGTQDNGTFLYQGSSTFWPETIFGDGGQSGFDASNPTNRFHTYFSSQVDSNFRGNDPTGWVWISDPFFRSPVEGASFYIPIIGDPLPAKGGTIFAGLQSVWRTRDNGGSQTYLEPNCSEVGPSTSLPCGDWVPLGSSTGLSTTTSRLTGTTYGATRTGQYVVAVARGTSDTSTLWAATRVGRVFISKNADSVSAVAGADGSDVTYTRLDSLAANSPGRFVSGIYVDPGNANHAWISYSGYSANTPATPGHVFSVTYDPLAGTATWTSIDGTMGDIPVNGIVRDDVTGDLYVANDFNVLRLPAGGTTWQTAAKGMPKVEVSGLSISSSAAVLYAATHGRGAYSLQLPRAKH